MYTIMYLIPYATIRMLTHRFGYFSSTILADLVYAGVTPADGGINRRARYLQQPIAGT